MNTEQRLALLKKFSNHLEQKIIKVQKDKQTFLKDIQNYEIDFESMPKIDILNDLTAYHDNINKTISKTYLSISNVTKELQSLKNRKQNTANLQDLLASISLVKQYSITLKSDNFTEIKELTKALRIYFEIRSKAKYCDNYVKQIDQEVDKIQKKYRAIFDTELTKTNSDSIKDLSEVLQVIKTNKKKINSQLNQSKQIEGDSQTNLASTLLIKKQSQNSVRSLSQISEFYVSMVKRQLQKFQQQLFNIPIVSSNPNQSSYHFFEIIKNSLKMIATIIQTYSANIIKLETIEGLHQVIQHVFKYAMDNLIFEVLVREKKYFQIDKINITRNKLGIKSSQYKVLKNYFKEFNAIWNQIQRFRIHLLSYIQNRNYEKQDLFKKELIDILNSSKFVQFNFDVILYFQAFNRHQFQKILKKNPFIVSLWQLDDGFFKQIRQKNQYKSNLSGHDFIEEIITKFSQGIKKSFQTLNILIVSALINFVNNKLIGDDSFFAFNELMTKFLGRISDQKAIEGIMILMNTISSYPKAMKSTFEELEIPEELPNERIKNQISDLIRNCKEKTAEFITESFDKILAHEMVVQKITTQSNLYQQVVTKLFPHLQKDLLQIFVYKMSRVHVDLILQSEFKTQYNHMDVLNFQKQIRSIINFYETKSHSIRQNFRRILDNIEVLLTENENELKKLIQEWKNKYSEGQLRKIWKLRSGN